MIHIWCGANIEFTEPYDIVSLCVASMLHPMNPLIPHLYTIDTLSNNDNNTYYYFNIFIFKNMTARKQ